MNKQKSKKDKELKLTENQMNQRIKFIKENKGNDIKNIKNGKMIQEEFIKNKFNNFFVEI